MKETVSLELSISSLEYVKGSVTLPPNTEYTLRITYPIEEIVSTKIKVGEKEMSELQLCREIFLVYYQIYQDPEKYGVWGHGLGDLVLESIEVDHDQKSIKIFVGS